MLSKQTNLKRPVAYKIGKEVSTSATGIYYWTIGTQQMDIEGNVYIDESIVRESFNADVVNMYAAQGVVVILEGETLEEYLENGFVYIDNGCASTANIRKVKEQEQLLIEKDKKNAELEAKIASMQSGFEKVANSPVNPNVTKRPRRTPAQMKQAEEEKARLKGGLNA
jgi:hypothetical protein